MSSSDESDFYNSDSDLESESGSEIIEFPVEPQEDFDIGEFIKKSKRTIKIVPSASRTTPPINKVIRVSEPVNIDLSSLTFLESDTSDPSKISPPLSQTVKVPSPVTTSTQTPDPIVPVINQLPPPQNLEQLNEKRLGESIGDYSYRVAYTKTVANNIINLNDQQSSNLGSAAVNNAKLGVVYSNTIESATSAVNNL